MFTHAFGVLQKVGKSLMLPVAVLPVAGLLLGLGATAVGGLLWELFPAAVGSEFEFQYRLAVKAGSRTSFLAYYPPLHAWFDVTAYPSEKGLADPHLVQQLEGQIGGLEQGGLSRLQSVIQQRLSQQQH